MAHIRKRQGTASEHQVVGQFLDAGFDVYQTIVDDQAIDAVLRVQPRRGPVRYFDLQIKSARQWSGIRGRVALLGKRKNTVLVLFNSSTHKCLWFDSKDITKYFTRGNSSWGSIFLKSWQVEQFENEGRNDLEQLRRLLEK